MTAKLELTSKEATQRAKEHATPISDLIGPSEVQDDADSWKEVQDARLESELHSSVDVILGEIHHSTHTALRDVIHTRALTCLRDDMPRASMDALSYKRPRQAVKAGFWPNQYTYSDVMIDLQELYPTCEDLPVGPYQQAREDVTRGLLEGMRPNVD